MSELRSKTVKNISYTGVAQIISFSLSVISLIVLARLLTPDDFGIVSIGLIFLGLFHNFQDFGVMPAVIQRGDRVEESISSGLFLRLIITCLLTILIAIISPMVAFFLGNLDVASVIMVYAANLFILPLCFAPQIRLTRALNFAKLSMASVAQATVLALASILFAILGYSYWSMVIGSILGSVAFVLVMSYHADWRVRPKMDAPLMRDLLGFGKHMLITSMMGFIIFNVDQFVIAKVLGVAFLGFYSIAVRFGRTTGDQISNIVNRVLFPTFSRIKEDIEKLRTGYTQSLRMIAIVMSPISFGISAISPIFVEVALGDQWLAVVIPLSILSFQGLLNAIITPASNVLISIGKPKYLAIIASVQALLLVLLIYPVAVYYGMVGICVLTTVLSLAVFISLQAVFARIFGSSFMSLIVPMFPAIASGIVLYIIVFGGSLILSYDLISLIALVAVGVAAYLGALHLFSRKKDVRDMLGMVRTMLGRSKSA